MRPARVSIGLEPEISRREIILLVVAGVVGNVHLAVDARQRAVGVDDRRGVVGDAGGAPLEERGDDDDPVAARRVGKGDRGRAGNRLGEIEQSGILALAEIRGAKQFGETDESGPAAGRFTDQIDRPRQVRGGIRAHAHLHQADATSSRSRPRHSPPHGAFHDHRAYSSRLTSKT